MPELLSLTPRGFSVSTAGRLHVFKPVSVQAMWYVNYCVSSFSAFIMCFFSVDILIVCSHTLHRSFTFDLMYAGLPSRCCTKHVRCPADTTISQEGWPLHGLAIMRAAYPQSRVVSMSGMLWQIWRTHGLTHQSCFLISEFICQRIGKSTISRLINWFW